jgi:hypothetical protein
MADNEEVGCTAARLVMRHGRNAPRFAETLAREMARAGRAVDSRQWQAVARMAGAILAGMSSAPWTKADSASLPSGPYDRQLSVN